MRNALKNSANTYFTPTDGSVRYYLDDISKYPIMSDSEIKDLILKSQNGDKKATDAIVKSNQRFVFMIAKRFSSGNSTLLLDLINEANIGLINSIRKFDVKTENRFLTYAVYWIQKQIFAYITFTEPMVRVSNKAKTARVPEIRNRFYMLNGRYPSPDEIISELESEHGLNILNESDVYQLNVSSIDIPITGNDGNEYSNSIDILGCNKDETFQTASENSYEDNIDSDYSKSLISNSMGVLTDRERKVIEMIYGIDNYRTYEIQEVSDEMGITKEGVRLINKRALEKLKNSVELYKKII